MKNKFFLLAPVAAFVAMFLFTLTLFPSVQPAPKNLPIALVNEDAGITVPGQGELNLGNNLVETMQQNTQAAEGDPAVKWVLVDSKDAVVNGLDNKDYYAALIIPADFSQKQSSLATPAPTNPTLEIFINQGMNAAAANVATVALNGMVDQMNVMMRTQILQGFEAQNLSLSVKQAQAIAVPIDKVVTNVNETGENTGSGNMPVSLFQPLWIASLATAVLLFFAVKKNPAVSMQQSIIQHVLQVVVAIVAACIIGFALPWLAGAVVGFDIPEYMPTALFLIITALAFITMILAVLSVIGLPGISIFVLLLFFGAPLLALAPEMMSNFYQDFVYAWLPMRFMVDGLREIFFFGTGVTWANTQVLVWIMIVSIVIIVLSSFLPKKKVD